jgi:hypothetical protein
MAPSEGNLRAREAPKKENDDACNRAMCTYMVLYVLRGADMRET